ncbi:alpha/beta hydrolase [Pinibacter aurantiacus]|uniref:Alpha/beta hydrolase n=1 Tax=Pinibacter aurantiacus TaxID=2851599 RepID=A0A9E2S7W0_9BACT|nr:alpha/beta hydrolase [Pinibacter aurantiacus]MBV4355565.1 alpha/beta hydrolase [Pinibacter aurantiacus]
MKKIFFFFAFLCAINASAQQQYDTIKNVRYYADSINKKDSYINSQCTIDIYYPKGAKNFATIVWFHGGGITGGKKEIPHALMQKGYAVIGVGYRLSPKVKAPAYIEDAAAAVAWTFQHIAEYGGNTDLIFVSGHSAGGYLGEMITLNKKYLDKYNIDANKIAEVVPFSGQAITHFTVRAEKGIKETQPVIDEYAPLFFVRADAPPMLLITGDREMELYGRYEENAYLNRMMKLAGHKRTTLYELQGFDHGGMAEPAFPLLLKEVGKRSKEILGN